LRTLRPWAWRTLGRRGLADEPKAIDLEWNARTLPDRAEAEAAIREIVGQRTVTDADLDLVKVDIARSAATVAGKRAS